jgi:pilus assembly protein FimV
VRPAQVPVEQAMAAILAQNPSAFINGNPALLKEAATITVPSAEQIAATTGTALPAITDKGATANRAAVAAATESTSKSGAVVEQLAGENSALKTQVSDLTGNVATLNQNLIQSEQRLHQLEAQLNELLQQMQQQRVTVAALSGAAELHSAPAAPSTGSMISQVNASELIGAPKPHTPWWVHMLYWLGIGGAITWAVREHFWPQRRLALAYGSSVYSDDRSNDLEAPTAARVAVSEPRSFAAQPLSNPKLALDLGALPDTAETIEHTVAPAPQLLKSGNEPVDASISAGVFVAFGRFEEAEQLLRNAIERDSVRTDLKLQLLDVFMQTDQPGAFDDLAADIERAATTPEVLAELAVLRDSYRPRHQ